MNNKLDFSAKGKYKNLPPQYIKARFALIDYAIGNPGIINFDYASAVLLDDAADILSSMVQKNLIGLNDNGEIEHLYPISCIETNHRVTLEDGRSFFAMCAIDH